jgi:tetratricopeptide (TPR) repeat protein
MAEEKVCASCGNSYSGAACPNCEGLERLNLLPSLPFISFVFAIFLLIGFSTTRIAVASYKAKQHSIATEWQRRGASDLRSGQSDAAVEDFENALVYDRENASFRLQLAIALVQAGRYSEAQSHLRNLWEERPGDSTVNLQLARLAARRGDLNQAERYYEGAIYGVWPDQQDPYAERAEVRLELAGALIRAGRKERAQAQLMSLSGELPTGSTQRKAVGDLLMKAGAAREAFQEYMEARTHQKGTGYALELAQAAFAQNDFASAMKWAKIALRENPKSIEVEEFAKTASRVVESDPYQKGIGEAQRAERVIRAFTTADARMAQCFPTYTLGPHSREAAASLSRLPSGTINQIVNFSTWAGQLRSQMALRRVQHRDDIQENAMRFVFQTEQFAAKNCSAVQTPADTALISLSKERWSNE